MGNTGRFQGQYFSGKGDVEYLQLLDTARRMFDPDPEFQNLPMLYTPQWNGLVEGPTWNAWWIQNSYGTTYCALPFLLEPYITFLQNAQDLWFDQMGDGKTVRPFQMGELRLDWIPPDGCLCDAAAPGWFVAKQGDGRVDIHDWGMEFTAAGLLMQAELLLISRNPEAIDRYLPKLERCAEFIESRRDPRNNLFLAGPAGNLLAPSYAGWKRPDGTYDMAYLAGLSITTIAALDRLIELEKLAGNARKARLYTGRRERARRGLALLTTEEGYFIKSLDPDGTKHGVYGAPKHGYFEAPPNHDAICFRVVDDEQAQRIYAKMASIPGLRPYDFILPNYPSLDDMYTEPEGLWAFGTWVNGGHWSTCEARMIMAYYRLGKYEDARRSMKRLLDFARRFRLDNPLVKFGSDVYQPGEPINITYDAFGPPAAMVRGLFEYLYRADGLTLIPHIPAGITELHQRFPVRLGKKRLYLSAVGQGSVHRVLVNGKDWQWHDETSVFLPEGHTPEEATIQVVLGDAKPTRVPKPAVPVPAKSVLSEFAKVSAPASLAPLRERVSTFARFLQRLEQAGLAQTYEGSHAQLILRQWLTVLRRVELQSMGKLARLPEPSQTAADKSYVDTLTKLCDGLEKVLDGYAHSRLAEKRRLAEIWQEVKKG
ncbi:MAG: hypothetical protein KatS3mg023_0399 [Armatimonadota bacterium]|nr:MAG: hypothetical protein KatS3mg023_0399 [Armatimonadota bacterium]